MNDKPSIGRIVHYVTHGAPGQPPEHRPAIIGIVHSDTLVAMTVFNPSGPAYVNGVDYDEEKTVGTWHWPERS